MRGFGKFVVWAGLILAAFVGVLMLTVVEVWTVPTDDPLLSASIQPNMMAGDVLLVGRRSKADQGELVRCLDPDAPGRYVLGRVVGLPGEEVHIHDDTMRINGKREPTGSPCDPPTLTLTVPQNSLEVDLACHFEEFAGRRQGIIRGITDHDAEFRGKVEAGKLFLASDNRRIHLDSRDFGAVNPDTCLQIVYRLWSAAGIGDAKGRFTFLW